MSGVIEYPTAPHRDYSVTPSSVDDNEYTLRRLLFLQHRGGEEYCMRYGDDGELQCQTCDIDFVRDPVSYISDKLGYIGLLRISAEQEGGE